MRLRAGDQEGGRSSSGRGGCEVRRLQYERDAAARVLRSDSAQRSRTRVSPVSADDPVSQRGATLVRPRVAPSRGYVARRVIAAVRRKATTAMASSRARGRGTRRGGRDAVQRSPRPRSRPSCRSTGPRRGAPNAEPRRSTGARVATAACSAVSTKPDRDPCGSEEEAASRDVVPVSARPRRWLRKRARLAERKQGAASIAEVPVGTLDAAAARL